ncbi:helix-turn-helix domain-containing protein [Paenibacillus sp. P26]|nr:helix-turn-helix domain-containing protein [Paenibacillus sp. P26]
MDSHRHFTSIVLEGKSIPEIVQELAKLSGFPAMLLGPELSPVSLSRHFRKPSSKTLAAVQDAIRRSPPAQSKFSFCLSADAEFPYHHVMVYPILPYQPQGYLVSLIEQEHYHDLPLLAMEQAANVISFEILKQQAVKERSRRYKNEFFSDLMEGFVTSEQEVLHRGKRYGLTGRNPYVMYRRQKRRFPGMSAQALTPEDDRFSEREDLYRSLKKELTDSGWPFVIFTKNDLFVFLLGSNANGSSAPAMNPRLAEGLSRITEKIHAQTGLAISFGVGNPVEKLLDLPVSYKEALDALQTGYHSNKQRFVQFYHIKEITDLLRMVPAEELRKFYTGTFKELYTLEEKERKELIKTLMTFYENHCQIAETAKQLYVHRNTVIYRLEKCVQLTGRNLRSSSDSLRFRIANLIEPLLK